VKVSNFQSGVITFLVSLKSDKSDLDNLGHIFRALDTNKDGLLSLREIREGIEAH
jgi:Ca2+-binding EF-hand superfamily protein